MLKAETSSKILTAEISEIFSSIQGEGPYLGSRQIFVRFGRCNMHCVYCDELEKMKEENFFRISVESLLNEIGTLERSKGPHQSVSLTGGEPLFYTDFLERFLPRLKERGFPVYLETNGTLPRQLSRVIAWCDVIAMDMKPVSSTGDRVWIKEHQSFLEIAAAKDVFVKVVVTAETAPEEVTACARLVQKVRPNTPFILQPQSELVGISQKALSLIESKIFPSISQILPDIRVIPQMHKIWGVR